MRISYIFLCLLFVIGGLITTEAQTIASYNSHDLMKLKTFLELPSASEGKRNIDFLWSVEGNAPESPLSETGIGWAEQIKGLLWTSFEDGKGINIKSIDFIDWSNCTEIQGDLDLSDCKRLVSARFEGNLLFSLDVSNCSSLLFLSFRFCLISSVNISGCDKLTHLDCDRNLLSFSDIYQLKKTYKYGFRYAPQDYTIDHKLGSNLDMSRFIHDGKTIFKWYAIVGLFFQEVFDIIEETVGLGVFFVPKKYAGTTLICKMTNSDFPDFKKFDLETPEGFIPIDHRMECFVNVSKSDIVGVEMIKSDISVYTQYGMLFVDAPESSQVFIYSIKGELINNCKIEGGKTSFLLPKGIYIIKVNDSVFKRKL